MGATAATCTERGHPQAPLRALAADRGRCGYTGAMLTEHPAVADQFLTILAARRNYTLRRLVAPGPDAAALSRIVEAGAHAPDHGLLRPWRFILIPQHRRGALGDVFADALLARDPASSDAARATAHDKALRARSEERRVGKECPV